MIPCIGIPCKGIPCQFPTISQEWIYRIEESTTVQAFIFLHGTWLWWTNFIFKWAGGSFHPRVLGWRVSRSQTNISQSQEGPCQYPAGKFRVSVKYRTKTQITCVNLQAYVKRSALEKVNPGTLSMGHSFCSCNPGRRRRPYLSTQWSCLPRDTQSSALLGRVLVLSPTAWRDGTSLNPAGSHHSSSCCVKLLCSP